MVEPNRVAESQRQGLAVESHLLMRRATWCGIVFALAVLITVLNIVPPVDVTYRVVSQAVISETRLNQLQINQPKPNSQPSRTSITPEIAGNVAAIERFKVLDRTQGDDSSALQSASEKQLVLVEVESKWSQRCNEAVYGVWFEEITRSKSTSDDTSLLGKQLRQARWELQAAEHYAEKQKFSQQSTASAAPSDGRTFQLATNTQDSAVNTEKLSATLTAFQHSDAEANSPRSTSTNELMDGSKAVDHALIAQVTAARAKVSEIELAWQRQNQQSSGDVRLSGAIRLVATPSTIPGWMAASVLIVGLASGASAGWLQYRMQSGGVYDPAMVARQLEHVGINASGKLQLADVCGGTEDWMERASTKVNTTGRRLARNLTIVSEVCVGVWLVVIVVRLASDPLWRTMLLESPLAAFGRLIVGMP